MSKTIHYSLRKAKLSARRRECLSSPSSIHDTLYEIIKKDPKFLVKLLNAQNRARLLGPKGH